MGEKNQDQEEDRNDSMDGVEKLLHELYYNPRHASAYTSIENVYRAAKKQLPSIKRNAVDRWFQPLYTSPFVYTSQQIK